MPPITKFPSLPCFSASLLLVSFASMALPHQLLLIFLFGMLLGQSLVKADTFIQSKAAFYPNSDNQGTSAGACGFNSFGATLNGGDVSAASNLYRSGMGCGACYQVKCTNAQFCSDDGVTVVITDSGASGNADFILSKHAFTRMAQTADAGVSLLALGEVDVQYRRVSCSYPSKNITFKIDESSSFPSYLAFVIEFLEGDKDVIDVQICETINLTCKLPYRSYGAVWVASPPPSGPLSVRMLLSGGDDGDETWLVAVNSIPQNWTAGAVYDSGVQVN